LSDPHFSPLDHLHMASALRLAARGLNSTQPNPRVGCIIARDDRVIGAGWHRRAGGPHAEVHALAQAGGAARGATAYVSLEPCAHHGRTPPCADALVEAGLARVVVAHADPYGPVDGRGVDRLRAAGIRVDVGLLAEEARELNRGFLCRVQRGRPWVRVKLAMSLDGRTALANGDSKWISGEAARADVQRWRARSSAILSGAGTVLADNPQLTVRSVDASGEQDTAPQISPLRVILDSRLRTPAGSHVLDGSVPTLVMHAPDAARPDTRFAQVECQPVEIVDGRLDLNSVLRELARREINELQVEAGPTVCGALLEGGWMHELLLYVAPVLLGDKAQPLLNLSGLQDMGDRWRLRMVDQRRIGADWRVQMRPMES
jgi:diaminohydroxyphosphoribosylaminopyrimidine deaminase/5-amino-6-(5-phosphoribosylamino)uracil reductase